MDKNALKSIVKLKNTGQFYQLSLGRTVGTEAGLAKDKLYLIQQDNTYDDFYDLQAKVDPIGYISGITTSFSSCTLTNPVTDYECFVIIAPIGTSSSGYCNIICLPSMMYSFFNTQNKILLKGQGNKYMAIYFTDEKTMYFAYAKSSSESYPPTEATILGVNL